MPEVQIEFIERNGQKFWQVHLGRRILTFREEQAARTFAALLHTRLGWLNENPQP